MGNIIVWRRWSTWSTNDCLFPTDDSLFREHSTDDSHLEPDERKPNLEAHPEPHDTRACSVAPQYHQRKRANDPFENLPEDLLSTILSKLPLHEVVRTTVLSKKWRHSWLLCPNLHIDNTAIGGTGTSIKLQSEKFIDSVDTVLHEHHGKVIEELGVKVRFHPTLVDHLNNCISFAVSAKIKYLSLDLLTGMYAGHEDDRYVFPFERLDDGTLSRLQRIQLSFVQFAPHLQFLGFPNLRKLDLHMVNASAEDFQNMLASCCKLEWLSMLKCNLSDEELKLDQPLPYLKYFSIKYCIMNTIELHAVNLATFVYIGKMVAIDLSKSLELENVNISFYTVTLLEHIINVLPYKLPNIQRLTLFSYFSIPKMPSLIDSPCKFSKMKHLQLQFHCPRDINISVASILKAAPLLEKLEMHFRITFGFLYTGLEPVRRSPLPECTYKHLKHACVTGFLATEGQLEFLEHLVENAHALEVLTVDTTNFVVVTDYKSSDRYLAAVRRITRRHIEGKIPPTCHLKIL